MSVFERLGKKREGGSRGRVPVDYVCNICGQPGHWIQQCPQKDQRRPVHVYGPPANICGHRIQQAPQKEEGWAGAGVRGAVSKPGGGGGKGGTGKGAGRPEAPSSEEVISELTKEMRENRAIIIEGGETQVRLFDTLLVRITPQDIILDTGGFFEDITMACMNESLADYGFCITPKDNGETWYVSDGKSRLYRYSDGLKLEGAAIDLKTGHSPMTPGVVPKRAGGPTRFVKSPGKGTGKGAARFVPY